MSEKSADKLIEQNTDRFLSSYSNQKFPDYPAYPDYFIDCYERYCPEGCDVECPGSEEGFLPVVQPKRLPGDVKNLMPILPKPGNCPKKEKRVYMRAHIGELTEDEIKFIRDTSYTDTLIVFRPVEDIPRNTPEEENEHSGLLASFEAFKIADRQGLSRQKRLQITTVMAMMKKASDFRKARKRAWGYASVIGNVPGIPAEQGSNREDTVATVVPVLKGLQMTNEKTNELLEKQNRLIENGTAVNKKGFDSLEPVSHQSLKELQNIKTAVNKALEAGTVHKDVVVSGSAAPPPKTKKKRVKSTNPKLQKPTKGAIHDALVALFHKNPEAARDYSAERLADILKSRKKNPIKRCTASGVKATLAWQKYCKPFRRREKTTSLNARGNTRDSRAKTPSEILDEQSADAQDELSDTDQN